MSEHNCETCAYRCNGITSAGICDYISITGHSRGCPPGAECIRYVDRNSAEGKQILETKAKTKGCLDAPDDVQGASRIGKVDWDTKKARQLWDDGYKISEIEAEVQSPKDDVRRYINMHPEKFPKAEREKNLKARAAQHPAPPITSTPEPPARKKRGPKLTWDVQLAMTLYADGKSFKEIADAVGAKYQSVINYANRHRDQFPIELQPPPEKGHRRSDPHTHTQHRKIKTPGDTNQSFEERAGSHSGSIG